MASNEPLIWESFLWGFLSATSLNIGSVIGVSYLPRPKLRAVLMSFGGGALLFALSIELFGNVLHASEQNDDKIPVVVMEVSATVGGVFFAMLNRALNNHGAATRKVSTTKNHLKRLRSMMLGGLAVRLGQISFFSGLTFHEEQELIHSAMYKERFRAGDIIMSSTTRNNGIFFIISGMVRVHLSGESTHQESSAQHCFAHRGSPSTTRTEIEPTETQHILPGILSPDCKDAGQNHTSTNKGQLHTWDLGPDKIFGDMAVLTGQHRTITVIALETTKLLVLPGHEIARLIDYPKVRDQLAARAIGLLRGIDTCHHLPSQDLLSLAERCSVVTYQPGELMFEGSVCKSTPILSLIHGAAEVRSGTDGCTKIVRAGQLLCEEHMRGAGSPQLVVYALEATTVLVIDRHDLDQVLAGQHALNSPSSEGPPETPSSAWLAAPCAKQKVSKLPALDKGVFPGQVSNVGMLPGQVSQEPIPKSINKVGINGLMPLEIERVEQLNLTTKSPDSGCPSPKSPEVSAIGHLMDWDSECYTLTEDAFQDRPRPSQGWKTIDGLDMLVTDQDLEEREQDIANLSSSANSGALLPAIMEAPDRKSVV